MKRLYFFSRLAGDSPEVLDECSQKERMNSSILGATLLIPTAIWALGGFSTAEMMGGSLPVCIATGIVAGIILLLMDRGMMVHFSKKHRSGAGLIARIALAVMASMVIAHPALFALAGGVVEKELARERTLLIEKRKSELAPQLASARIRADNGLAERQSALSSAQDSLRAKETALEATRKLLSDWRAEADKEGAGNRAGRAGYGTRYYKILEENVRPLETQESTQREELKLATDRVANLEKALENARTRASDAPEIARLQADLTDDLDAIKRNEGRDPFSYFEALHNAIAREWDAGHHVLGIGYVVVCLVLLGLELIPLFLKMGAGITEQSLKLDSLFRKVLEDHKNIEQVYPAISIDSMRQKLDAERRKEALRIDHDLAMETIREHRKLARSIMLEKSEVFEMAEEVMQRVPRKARPEHREFAELLAKQLIANFLHSVESTIPQRHAGAAGAI